MENIKVKVNLPKKIYELLTNDMESFGFVKSTGEVNKNAFINILIKNYFPIFNGAERDFLLRVGERIKINDEDFPLLTSVIFDKPFKKEGNFLKEVQFLISKENEGIYEEITTLCLKNRSISQYFRDMFILYSDNPQDIREEIIFKDNVVKIREVIALNKKAYVSTKERKLVKVNIYSLSMTKEGMFVYLLAVEEENRKLVSFHLKDIVNIILVNDEDRFFTSEEKEKLELTIRQNPAFPINEVLDVKVELTPIGIKLFNLYIHDRPHPYKVEGNTYYFKAGLTHIVIYFFKFASEAKFLAPDSLIEFMKEQYHKAYKQY